MTLFPTILVMIVVIAAACAVRRYCIDFTRRNPHKAREAVEIRQNDVAVLEALENAASRLTVVVLQDNTCARAQCPQEIDNAVIVAVACTSNVVVVAAVVAAIVIAAVVTHNFIHLLSFFLTLYAVQLDKVLRSRIGSCGFCTRNQSL